MLISLCVAPISILLYILDEIVLSSLCGLSESFPSPHLQVAERGWIPGLKGSPALVSYIACAAAGSSNILFSRQNELREGAAVTDDSGKVSRNQASDYDMMTISTVITLLLSHRCMVTLSLLDVVSSCKQLSRGGCLSLHLSFSYLVSS